MVGEHVFVDLLQGLVSEKSDRVMKAYSRGAPESQPKPANEKDFGGIFQEL